jgi:hypothetical protein
VATDPDARCPHLSKPFGFSPEDNLFDSDDEDEESYVNVPNFMNVIMRSSTLASAMAGRHRGGINGPGDSMNMNGGVTTSIRYSPARHLLLLPQRVPHANRLKRALRNCG